TQSVSLLEGQSWIFQLHDGWKLTKITVYYTEKDCIYSPIVFTYLDENNIKQEKQVGGNPPTNALEGQVIIEDGEKITGISGTVGSHTVYKVITSLCFIVGTKTYGPYGPQNGTSFSLPGTSFSLPVTSGFSVRSVELSVCHFGCIYIAIVASSTFIFPSKSLQFEHSPFIEGLGESLGGVECPTEETTR
ncbi:GOS9-like protein, partial [Tanacetum coccineum]